MSTLFNERTPFDLLFRNLFKADGVFQPTTFENKQPHPLDIYYDDKGLHFEVACTGLSKKDIQLEIDGDLLQIIYDKPNDDLSEDTYAGYIYKGLSKRSFNLGYKVAAKFELEQLEAEMKDGLLHLFIPIAESKKPKSIKIK
jgi:HSP20 family molecular chaperone IbpA|tara:strand:+ start:90 stop:515 length:426 start_codon:yes stop_codon:yes gene_type:complete